MRSCRSSDCGPIWHAPAPISSAILTPETKPPKALAAFGDQGGPSVGLAPTTTRQKYNPDEPAAQPTLVVEPEARVRSTVPCLDCDGRDYVVHNNGDRECENCGNIVNLQLAVASVVSRTL